MDTPDIYAYLDYRAFLSAWFDARKEQNPRFSHRLFARLADQKSPSLLLQVIQRKRNLSEVTAPEFARAMKLDPDETSFFFALVALDQAPSDEARNEAWATLTAEKRFRGARHIEGAAFEYLSHGYLPAIRELAALPGFRADPAWVASVLRPRLTTEQARDALDLLQRLGMLVPGPDGTLRPAEVSLVTPREVGTLAVHNYHRDMALRSQAAIGDTPPDQRHYLGLTLAIPPSLMPVLKEQLNALQTRLLDLADASPDLKRRVVQVNLHLFPLSEDV